MARRHQIVVADDDPQVLGALRLSLTAWGYEVTTACNGRECLEKVGSDHPSLVLADLAMPEANGLEVVSSLQRTHPDLPVVVFTGFGSMETTIRVIQAGAFDYLTKPLDADKVRQVADRAIRAHAAARAAGLPASDSSSSEPGRTRIVGESQAIRETFKRIGSVTGPGNDCPVLIRGETGTGKELVARVIHESSERRHRPFVVINCTVLPEQLLESELFGFERGAFTGAVRTKPGKLEIAGDGTIFFDEIGDLALPLQNKLLRVLQERETERIGGTTVQRVRARFLFATHHELESEVPQGRFRADLYYRVNVFPIVLPPLRDRRSDIPVLAEHFLRRQARRYAKPSLRFAQETIDLLARNPFPGNVRELENLVDALVLSASGPVITPDLLPAGPAWTGWAPRESGDSEVECFDAERARCIRVFERQYIERVLSQSGGVVMEAARRAGMRRQSFYRLMKRHGISPPRIRRHSIHPDGDGMSPGRCQPGPLQEAGSSPPFTRNPNPDP